MPTDFGGITKGIAGILFIQRLFLYLKMFSKIHNLFISQKTSVIRDFVQQLSEQN